MAEGITEYFPSEDGQYGNTGGTSFAYSRIRIYEETDPDNNTSTLTVNYQIKVQKSNAKSSSYTRQGKIAIDDVERNIGATNVSVAYDSKLPWVNKWTGTWTIPHETDGSKTITLTVSGGSYGAGGALMYLYGTGQKWTTSTGRGTMSITLTKFNRGDGVPVYIGGNAYDCYIGNADGTWSAYDPVIG